MRRALSLVVATVMVAGFALVAAAPAGASREAGEKKSRFCKALAKFDTGELGNPTTESGAAKTAKELKKVRRAARGDTKDALDEIIDAYEQVADGDERAQGVRERRLHLGGRHVRRGIGEVHRHQPARHHAAGRPRPARPDAAGSQRQLAGSRYRGRPTLGAMNTMSASASRSPSHDDVPHT